METGYEDIDKLNQSVNDMYDKQLEQQRNIIDTSTQQTVDELNRNKQKYEEQANKVNRGLYTDYKKQINPYGTNAENMAANGLNGGGLSETTKANYYNTYQNARAEATNTANTIKADFDAQIAMARQNGDIQQAQAALEMYRQKINDLYNTYNLKYQQDQFNYQKEQDNRTQNNWEREFERAREQAEWDRDYRERQFDYNRSQDERNYNYQLDRDRVADEQWNKQYDYNKSVNDRNYEYQVNRDKVTDEKWQKEYEEARRQALWEQEYKNKQFDYNKEVNDRNYNYQVDRDRIEDEQWQKQYDYNKSVNDRNYNYQVNRDAIEDSQWQKQYELSKKNSSVSSSRSSSGSGSSGTLNVSDNSGINVQETQTNNTRGNTQAGGGAGSFGGGAGGGGFRGETSSNDITPQQIIANAKLTQGTGKSKVIDGISGKTFNTMDELLAYYGYATVN